VSPILVVMTLSGHNAPHDDATVLSMPSEGLLVTMVMAAICKTNADLLLTVAMATWI
jgi:hypothetical protein